MASKRATKKGVNQTALTDTIKVQGLQQFKEVSETLRQQGYTALPAVLGGGGGGPQYGMDDFYNTKMSCSCDDVGGGKSKMLPLLHVSSGGEVKVSSCGTKDLGYITWGWGNKLPNVVKLFTDISPYTAAGQKFLNDLLEGMGPQPMFHYTQYIGGNITEKEIPFYHAGTLLKGQIRDLQQQLLKLEEEHPELKDSAQGDSPSVLPLTLPQQQGQSPSAQSAAEQMHADLKEQIADLKERLERWELVTKQVETFERDNHLHDTCLSLAGDLNLLWQAFPEIELSQSSFDEETGEVDKQEIKGWHPRATGLRYRSAHICRKERMDNQNRINYVYLSNLWLDEPNTTPDPTGITALPAISAKSPTKDLERLVREARSARIGKKNRPTRIIFPISYTSPGRPYYPVPAWHSIFAGDIYLYAATLISDRKKRRDNANVIGKIIFLSDEYLQRLYQQRNAVTDEDKKKLFMSVIEDINTFLENRDNMGKPLIAYNFTGADGKTYKSWEIVEIEENSKSTADANQTELAEISSIIFFAMGLDSQLVGNTPGTTTRSGGTDLRERYLLKQVQMSTMQQLLLKPLEVISQFNGWDKAGLVWRIKREVLTTLDNSKTGITNAETE
jgi:hypothetical protein